MEEKKIAVNFVRIRGLPFSAGEADVKSFFEGMHFHTTSLESFCTTLFQGRKCWMSN